MFIIIISNSIKFKFSNLFVSWLVQIISFYCKCFLFFCDTTICPLNIYFQELIETIIQLQNNLRDQTKRKTELEEYLDNLLLRVMDAAPKILQTPYIY